MKPERWAQIKSIFYEAAERPVPERAAFIRSRCGDDESLAMEIESLLGAHDQAGSFIEEPPVTLDAQSPDPMIGRRIGAYEIIREIGRGGMGAVYLAQDTRLGRHVALKLLGDGSTTDPSHIRRFEQEARAASALNHPNIVTIHDIAEAEAGRFIIMELTEGQTLREVAGKPLALDALVKLVGQIAKALNVARETMKSGWPIPMAPTPSSSPPWVLNPPAPRAGHPTAR